MDRSGEERFVQLFHQHERRIYGFIVSLVPRWEDADDLFQETAAVLWRKFDRFEPGTDFVRWALSVAQFEVLRYRRARQKSQRIFSDATVEALAERLPAFGETSSRRTEALQHCLTTLKERDRELVQMRYDPGATVLEVAARVGRSVPAVYKALNRIHGQLFDCIRRTLA